MKLEEVSTYHKSDGELLSFMIIFRSQSYEECTATLSPDTRMIHLWSLLEEHIKTKLAEKLGIEEPLHKPAIDEGIWTTTESAHNSGVEELIDDALGEVRDLGLKERDCDH